MKQPALIVKNIEFVGNEINVAIIHYKFEKIDYFSTFVKNT